MYRCLGGNRSFSANNSLIRSLYGPNTGAARDTVSVYDAGAAEAMAFRTVRREHFNSRAIYRILFSSTK